MQQNENSQNLASVVSSPTCPPTQRNHFYCCFFPTICKLSKKDFACSNFLILVCYHETFLSTYYILEMILYRKLVCYSDSQRFVSPINLCPIRSLTSSQPTIRGGSHRNVQCHWWQSVMRFKLQPRNCGGSGAQSPFIN